MAANFSQAMAFHADERDVLVSAGPTQILANGFRCLDVAGIVVPGKRLGIKTRWCCLVLAAVLPWTSTTSGADLPLVRSSSILLRADEMVPATAANGRPALAWVTAGIRMETLLRFGRLVPPELAEADRKALIAYLQDPQASGDGELLRAYPMADDLVFDGERYAGANLSYIDSMLGKFGRPVAFDRALPALLVPIAPEVESVLNERRASFQASDDHRLARETADRIFGVGASSAEFADGQFLRAYSGRFDDLYFHLFQNGNGASAMAFDALAAGLGSRTYQPVQGLCRKENVPAAGFDMDDILSDGGKTAVTNYLRTKPDRPAEAFKDFAFRILPNMIFKTRALSPGARFSATPAEILQALRARQQFYPLQVPPLYRSPDRFLGWAGSLFLPVANAPALPPGAADSWYPLPQREGRGPADLAADGTSSAELFKSSTAPEMVWEDPQLSNLLAAPDTNGAPARAPSGEIPASGAARPKVESDPRLRATTARLVVVVTPTGEEAEQYLAAIRANDETLRGIEQARGRIRLVREFIETARAVASAPGEKSSPLPEILQRSIASDLASDQVSETALGARLQEALQQRAGLRIDLERRLLRDRVAPLDVLGKKAEAPAPEKSGDRLTL